MQEQEQPAALQDGSSGEPSADLPAITVEAPSEPVAPPTPTATPVRATATVPSNEQTEAAQSEPAVESAWGPVDGLIAQNSSTGIKTDTPLDEIPQSITVVTSEQIQQQAATSVMQALRYVPGVYAEAYGFDVRGDAALVRGVAPVEYLDGLRRFYGYYNNSNVDPYTLERIEVLKGPASVLYGAGSVGGIINMISKRPQEENHTEIGVMYGSNDFKQVQGDSTGKITKDGKWLYRLVGVARESNTQVDYTDYDRYVIQPSITWRPDDRTNLTILANFQKDDSGSTTAFLPWEGTLFKGPNGKIRWGRMTSEPSWDQYKTETQSVTVLFDRQLNDTFTFRENMRYTHTKVDYRSLYPNVYSNPLNPFLDPARRTVTRYSYSSHPTTHVFNSDTNLIADFNTGPITHKLLTGVDYTHFTERNSAGYGYVATPFDLYSPVYNNGFTPPPLSYVPESGTTQTGVYAQDQIEFGRWITVLGIRYDDVTNSTEGSADENNDATTYRAGLMYAFDNGFTPYVSYIQSFEPVLGLDFYNQPYEPLEGEQWEVGFKYRSNSMPLAVNAALFDITEKNRQSTDPNNPFNQIQLGEARSRGGEIETIFTLNKNLDVIAGYSYTDAEITQGDNKGNQVASVPLHQASAWATYRFSVMGISGFAVGGGVRYVGSSWDGVDTIETPSHTLYDAMLSFETDHWRYQINGTNLGDEKYMSTCLARGDCFLGVRRTVLGQVTYKF
ncbi:TonB-dependent siderophore receptor [Methyloligella sp. 2.7D]|uniref:TonB-dependent siderophore receptor n=1 Tax=unclassified Methyloligella TaxID=2625955 RepID=UPI001FEFFAAB|nr:TonB-dependent siderophore receptor [Methyloligella sp. GL2]